jgi:hypothetical protein
MSELRIEKRREAADVTLVTGTTLSGVFFLSSSSQVRSGPERVGDVLNFQDGFFPFESDGVTSLINCAHVLKVALPAQMIEPELDTGYHMATRCQVRILLTNGETVIGQVVIFRPQGHDRLSDYARMDERFRYVELTDHTLLVNSAHIVALTEVGQL